ncbi:MAG: T9SS type A sorting domain-containing protein, partial [Bacteroidota bacterium]
MIAVPISVSSQLGGGCGCDEFIPDGIELSLFQAFFEDCTLGTGSGFAEEALDDQGQSIGRNRREVFCAVLQYLENIIVPNESVCDPGVQQRVNIQVQPSFALEDYIGDDDLPPFNPQVIGYASFYLPRFDGYFGDVGGIIHPAPWVVINSGVSPFVSNLDSYHALARFNFADFGDMNTDYENPVTEGRDLYSVVLHEVMHCLGFASAFTAPGNFLGNTTPGGEGIYFPFDEFLTYNGQPVIERSLPEGNFPLGGRFTFNDELLYDDLFGICGGDDGTHLIFNGEIAGGHRIYTGDQWEEGSSFSHLDGSCVANEDDFVEFVMNPNFPVGVDRRVLLDAELDILRTIGYNINCDAADYSVFDCDAADCAIGSAHNGTAVDDCDQGEPFVYEFSICPPDGGSIDIPLADILFNDPNAAVDGLAFAYTDDVSGGEVSLSADGTALVYTATTIGTKVIAYAGQGCGGQVSNTSLIYINVTVADDPDCLFFCADIPTCAELDYPVEWGDNCETAADCPDNPDGPCRNLLCNGGFCGALAAENLDLLYEERPGSFPFRRIAVFDDFTFTNDAYVVNIPGWTRASGSPDYITDDNGGAATLEHGIALGGVPDFSGQPNRNEGVLTFLPFQPDRNYLFSFDIGAVSADNMNYNLDVTLVHGAEFVPSPSTESADPIGPTYEGNLQDVLSRSQDFPTAALGRDGGCFSPMEEFTALWIHIPTMLTSSSYLVFDNMEIIEDNFSAGADLLSLQCGQTQTLGGEEFCMLSGPTMRYDWYELDEAGALIEPPLHTYTRINGVITGENTLTVAPIQTTRYRLVRTITDLGDLPEDFALCLTEDEVTITVTEQAPTAAFTWVETACGEFDFTSDPSAAGNSHVWYLNAVDEASIFSMEPNPTGLVLANGISTIIHEVSGRCGTDIAEVTLPKVDCDNCATPMAGFTYTQDCDAGVVILTAGNMEGIHDWVVDGMAFNNTTTVTLPIDDLNQAFTATVTHTVTNTCGESNSITQVIDDLEVCCTVIVAGFDVEQDCDAGTVTLTAFNPAGVHTWSVDGVPYTGTPLILPITDLTVPFTATVDHRVINECDQSAGVQFTIDNLEACCTAIAAGFTYEQDCDAGTLTLTATNPFGVHDWLIDGIPASGAMVMVPIPDLTSPFMPNVDHLVSNECGQTDVVQVTIDDLEACQAAIACPCEGENAINIDAGEGTPWQLTALNDPDLIEAGPFSPNILDLTEHCISIRGRLLIQPLDIPDFMADLLITGGFLRMEQGAEIVVEDGADLLIISVNEADPDGGTGIHACDSQWPGITAEGGGKLRVYDSQLEDAIFAIQALPDATIDVSGNTFNDNSVGISLGVSTPDLQLHEINIGINGIVNNIFENGQVGISALQTQWVILGSLTGAGINTYRNLGRGVFIEHGNVGVYNSTFQNISNAGIRHFTGNGFVFAFNNFFDGMEFGVSSLDASILASNNFMQQISNTGIQLQAGVFENSVVECRRNIITADRAGIDLNFQATGSLIRIDDENEITLTPTTINMNRSAIRILGAGENAIARGESLIRSNTITVNSIGTGIELMNLGDIDIHYNNIVFQSPLATDNAVNRGISLGNADENYLYGNTVSLGAGSADFTDLTAFHIAACQNTIMCCNSSDGGNIGFLFSENCENTQFRHSTIGSHTVGLEVEVATTMSTQTHGGNMWEGSYGEAGARNLGVNFEEIQNSLFRLEQPNSSRPTLWPPEQPVTPNTPGATWFGPWPGNALFCETDDTCLPVPTETNGNVKEDDVRFAQGVHLSSPYGIFINWEGSKYLYGKLDAAPDLIRYNTDIQQFYTNTQQSSLAQYYALSQTVRNLPSAGDQGTLVESLGQIAMWLEEMTELELRYNATTSEEERDQFDAAYDLLYQRVTERVGASYQSQQQQTELRNTVISQLLTQNSGLVVEHDYAQYEKQMNNIQFNRLLTGSTNLSTGEVTELEAIAYLCPLNGGNAVYRARAMLKSQEDYNFAGVACNFDSGSSLSSNLQQGDQMGKTSTQLEFDRDQNEVKNWKSFPNPTRQVISLTGGELSAVERINLLDINGKYLAEWSSILPPVLSLPAGLNDGLYLLRIQEIDGTVQTIKIIISN